MEYVFEQAQQGPCTSVVVLVIKVLGDKLGEQPRLDDAIGNAHAGFPLLAELDEGEDSQVVAPKAVWELTECASPGAEKQSASSGAL